MPQVPIKFLHRKFRQIVAFTLAEVLITLLIIGIVASLVIPALINETNKAEYVTKLQKEYAVLQQAFKLLALDAGGSILNNPNFNSSTGNKQIDAQAMNDFATKLNVVKNCGNGMGCLYASPVKTLSGTVDEDNLDLNYNNNYGKAIMADGTMMMVDIDNTNCSSTPGSAPAGSPLYGSLCGAIYFDINGATGPNQFGRDYFVFWITKTGIYPVGTFNDGRSCSINSATYLTSYGCTGKVLSEGAMNY